MIEIKQVIKRGLITLLIVSLLRQASIAQSNSESEMAQNILKATGVQGGFIVHLGCGKGKLTAALRPNDRYLVHGLDGNVKNIAQARQYIRSLGVYDPVSVEHFAQERLPYIDNLVNLIVCETPGQVNMKEIMRVLCPEGVAYFKKEQHLDKKGQTATGRDRRVDALSVRCQR